MRSLQALPSYFVGYAAFEALTALPRGVWDRFHMGQDDPPPESTKGYRESKFEKEFKTIKEICYSFKAQQPTLYLSDPVDCVEAVFEDIAEVLLGCKVNMLTEMRKSLQNVNYEKLAFYFVQEHSKVGFCLFKKIKKRSK